MAPVDLRSRNEKSMNLNLAIHRVEKLLRDNSSTIFTALGVSGTLSTAYLAVKASFKAARTIDLRQAQHDLEEKSHSFDNKEKALMIWKLYIPAGVSGSLTIGCIIAGAKIGSKRTAAAYSLLSISEKAFSEYKDKVVEQLGEKKEKTIRDEIAQDRVNADPEKGIVIVGPGNVLCYEQHTGRYFNSDMETLRKAVNTINAKMIREIDATLSDFYYLVRLPVTSFSSMTGWNSDKMLELYFSTSLAEDGRPCLTFDYNYVIPF